MVRSQLRPAPLSSSVVQVHVFGNGCIEEIVDQTVEKPASRYELPGVSGNHCSMRLPSSRPVVQATAPVVASTAPNPESELCR